MATLERTSLVVIVPTYNRPAQLSWSLSSVLRQEVQTAAGARRRVVVVNNGTARADVDAAVAAAVADGNRGWDLATIHRDPPMDPALSWYGAMETEASEGDLVFLHGDDDLMMPGSLQMRARALVESGGACLLSQSYSGLVFDTRRTDVAYLKPIPQSLPERLAWKRESGAGLAGSGAAFIGNLGYRVGPELCAAIEEAKGWLLALPLSGHQQLAMLPFFVTVSVATRGQLVSSAQRFTIRGQSTGELTGQKFGHGSWRPGVLYLLCFRVLTSAPLSGRSDLEPLRAEYWRLASRWRLPTLASAVSRAEWYALGGSALLRRRARPPLGETLRGAVMVARAFTGTQAVRARLFGWRDGRSRRALLDHLWACVNGASRNGSTGSHP